MTVTDCPKGHGRLQDLGSAVPWCGECAWIPPGTEHIAVPLPDDGEHYEIALPPEKGQEDDHRWYRRTRLPDQDDERIRQAILNEKVRPAGLRKWHERNWRAPGSPGTTR